MPCPRAPSSALRAARSSLAGRVHHRASRPLPLSRAVSVSVSPPLRSSSTSSRAFSSRAPDDDVDHESFDVPCGCAGSITVDIFNRHLLATPSTPLIIYLPPTSVQLRLGPAATPALDARLASYSSVLGQLPVAQINYRWGIPSGPRDLDVDVDAAAASSHPYPTPLHDTLHAYTWLTTSLLPSHSPPASSHPPPRRSPSPYASAPSSPAERDGPRPRPLLIYGSLLGGTLASALSLTETRARPAGHAIAGTLIRNGIFDWTRAATSARDPPFPSETGTTDVSPSRLNSNPNSTWDLDTLHALKTRLFAAPASAFEPFASPVLFFRSPGFSIPARFPGTAPPARDRAAAHDPALLLDGLSISEEELASLRASSPPSPSPSTDDEVSVERKSALRFPPRDSGLVIPRSLILTASHTSPDSQPAPKKRGRGKSKSKTPRPGEEMRRQAEEMARAMRRSLVMYEFKERAAWDADGDPRVLSEERVQLRDVGGEEEEGDVVREWVEGMGL